MANSTSSVILFDSGRSYVVRGFHIEHDTEYRFTDSLGRTELDRKFLNQFEKIFLAAADGDLKTCQEVVDEGFCDFNAVSYGRFGTSFGKRLDGISPLQIAEERGCREVVELFKKVQSNKASFPSKSLQNRTEDLSQQKRELENKDLYAQKIERELRAYYSTSKHSKEQTKAQVKYECIKTTNEAWGVYDVSVTEGEREFKAILYNNKIIIKNNTTEEEIVTSEAHQGTITSLCAQGELFFSASEDKTLKAWDAKTGKCLQTFYGHTGKVKRVCVQNNLLISGSEDKTIKIWDIETGECLKTFTGHLKTVSALAVQGKFIVSGSWDKCIRIWNMETLENVKTLKGHDDWVNVLFIQDDLIYSGSDDKTIKIWDLKDGECLNTLNGHRLGIFKLKIEDGKLISRTFHSEEVKVWVLKN